jgi:hypothetical protein
MLTKLNTLENYVLNDNVNVGVNLKEMRIDN